MARLPAARGRDRLTFGHLECIGIPGASRDDLAASAVRVAALATSVPLTGGGQFLAWEDASGARMTLVTNPDGAIACLTPAFTTHAALAVTTGAFGPSDCPWETPLFVEVADRHGEPCYPMAVQIDDLAVSSAAFATPGPRRLRLAAFAEDWQLFRSEAAYRDSGTPMAVESLIPSGLFRPGVVQSDASAAAGDGTPFEPAPRILMSGTIVHREQRVNRAFDRPFVWLQVRSLCHTFDVVAPGSLEDVGDATILSGTFWLSGRLA